jgi:UDP-glucose 4-epimerase
MNKVLVTGGGFLGHHLVQELSLRGIEIIVYDVLKPKSISEYLKTGLVHFVQGDIRDLSKLEETMDGCDTVFHTAAIANIDEARQKPVDTIEINVVGTVNCLEAARRKGVQRFIYASSVYVSGSRGSFYRISKQTGESLCKSYCKDFGLNYTIIRYGSLYGREPNHWNFLYTVLKQLLTTKEYDYYGLPEAEREYIHINDAARESIKIAANPEFSNKAVLITGHQRRTMKAFFDMIQEILGEDIKINYMQNDSHAHYKITPYTFEADIPLRINLPTYIDISEGILDCAKEVQKEIENDGNKKSKNSNTE